MNVASFQNANVFVTKETSWERL